MENADKQAKTEEEPKENAVLPDFWTKPSNGNHSDQMANTNTKKSKLAAAIN